MIVIVCSAVGHERISLENNSKVFHRAVLFLAHEGPHSCDNSMSHMLLLNLKMLLLIVYHAISHAVKVTVVRINLMGVS